MLLRSPRLKAPEVPANRTRPMLIHPSYLTLVHVARVRDTVEIDWSCRWLFTVLVPGPPPPRSPVQSPPLLLLVVHKFHDGQELVKTCEVFLFSRYVDLLQNLVCLGLQMEGGADQTRLALFQTHKNAVLTAVSSSPAASRAPSSSSSASHPLGRNVWKRVMADHRSQTSAHRPNTRTRHKLTYCRRRHC